MSIIKVSVIIPTYKRAEMLPRAINSVLEQSYKNIEVVVVDDNNPDTEWLSLIHIWKSCGSCSEYKTRRGLYPTQG